MRPLRSLRLNFIYPSTPQIFTKVRKQEKIIFQDRFNANSYIKVIDKSICYTIPFEEDVYVARIGTNADPKSTFVRVTYTSLTTPTSVFDLDFESQKLSLKKQEEIVGGYDSKEYSCERLWITSRDGIKIPISLVYKKNLYIKGESPLLLYGYGSYGHSIDPAFGVARLSLLNRGFCFCNCPYQRWRRNG